MSELKCPCCQQSGHIVPMPSPVTGKVSMWCESGCGCAWDESKRAAPPSDGRKPTAWIAERDLSDGNSWTVLFATEKEADDWLATGGGGKTSKTPLYISADTQPVGGGNG